MMKNNKNCQKVPEKIKEHFFYSEFTSRTSHVTAPTLERRKKHEEEMSDEQPLIKRGVFNLVFLFF